MSVFIDMDGNSSSSDLGWDRELDESGGAPQGCRGVSTCDVGTPAFCSTRARGQLPISNPPTLSCVPNAGDPAMGVLISNIAQQVGQEIRDQLSSAGVGGASGARVQYGADQTAGEPTYVNLTGARLVMQADVKEPPVFRGDGSDKFTVDDWQEMMEVYLQRRAVPLSEQHTEVMCRLMGKARDVVKITLRSSVGLETQSDPKQIFDVLKRHFGGYSSSAMPMADFYNTIPVAGETQMAYWLRLNKAADAAAEALERSGRRTHDPCQELPMMFVKYCPDPALSAVYKFKAPQQWTAGEIQEHLDRHHIEMGTPHTRHVGIHTQAPAFNGSDAQQDRNGNMEKESGVMEKSRCDEGCMEMLVNILDRVLSQNKQTNRPINTQTHGPGAPYQMQAQLCKVCKSAEHTTTGHCRKERLCLSCFQPNHLIRNCPNRPARSEYLAST